MKVADLSVEELKALIAEIMEDKLGEILGDPDWGLDLKEDVQRRLKESLANLKKGKGGIPAEEVAQKLGFIKG